MSRYLPSLLSAACTCFLLAFTSSLLLRVSAAEPEWPQSQAFLTSTCFSSAELAALDITPVKRSASLAPLRLERNAWQGHFLSTATAGIVLKELMGYSLVVEDTDGISVYERCASEPERVCLETWPLSLSSRTYEEVFTNTGQCTSAGALGVIGRSGWYVPRWLEEEDATKGLYTEFWRSFTDPAVTSLFPKSGTVPQASLEGYGREFVPPWCIASTTPPGCTVSSLDEAYNEGQCVVTHAPECIELLAIDASYDAGILPQQVYNNRLNITVPYSQKSINCMPECAQLGENTFYSEVLARYDAHIPFLFYLWSPTSFILSRPFTRVSLKEWTPLCFSNDTASIDGFGSVDCDFPSQYTAKIMSSKLLSQPAFADAVSMLQRFTLSNIDQTLMLEEFGLDDPAKWDAHAFNISCAFLKARPHSLRTWAHNTPIAESVLKPIGAGVKNGMLALVVVGALCSLVLHVLLLVWRSHPIIVSSSVSFCQLIVLGSWAAYAAILLLPYRATGGVCTAVPLLLCVAFSLTFGSLFVKTWRLMRIFRRRSLSVVRVSNLDLLKLLGLMSLYDAVVIGVWNGVDAPRYGLVPTAADPLVLVESCTSQQHEGLWYGLLLGPKAALVLWGIATTWQVRGVTSNFNESRFIGISIYNLSVIAVLVLPLLEVLSSQPDAAYLLYAMGILVVTLVTLASLFVPKILNILTLKGAGTHGLELAAGGGNKTVCAAPQSHMDHQQDSTATNNNTGHVKSHSGGKNHQNGNSVLTATKGAPSAHTTGIHIDGPSPKSTQQAWGANNAAAPGTGASSRPPLAPSRRGTGEAALTLPAGATGAGLAVANGSHARGSSRSEAVSTNGSAMGVRHYASDSAGEAVVVHMSSPTPAALAVGSEVDLIAAGRSPTPAA